MRLSLDMLACTNCQKREFQMTQLSEMRLLAECAGCGASFVVDSVSEKKSRIEAADPNQHLIWNWKSEQWAPAKGGKGLFSDMGRELPRLRLTLPGGPWRSGFQSQSFS